MNKKGSAIIVAALIVLLLAIIGAALWIYSKHLSEQTSIELTRSVTSSDTLNIGADGTAYVVGKVIAQIHGCEVDGECFLVVRAQDQNIDLAYAGGYTPGACPYQQPADWEGAKGTQNGKVGTIVQAYGAIYKIDHPSGQYAETYSMDFCKSPRYFMLGENDPIPTGTGPGMSNPL